jgi:chromosomal replication initiator protein
VVVMEPPAIPEPIAVAEPPPPSVPEVVTEIEEGPRPVTIKEIQKCITKHFDLSMTELLSSRRLAKIVRPRQIGFYLARKLTSRSLPEIGRKFGGKDHTTILHACKKVEERMAKDPQLAETVRHLEGMFA